MKTISLLINHHGGPTAGVLIGKNADGVWEFPNGTVKTNETEAEACVRIAAQLGIVMTPGKMTMIGAKHPQDGRTEHILCGNIKHNTNTKCNSHVYWDGVNKFQDEPKACCCYSEYKWVHPSELAQYEFAGDDVNFMAKYDPWINPKFIPDVRML